MMRCSPEAFALCPTRHLCGSLADAVFTDDSICASFNKAVEEANPQGIRPYPYYEAYMEHQLVKAALVKLLNSYVPCEGPDWRDGGCPDRVHGNCGEWGKLSPCVAEHLAEYLVACGVTIRKDVPSQVSEAKE